MTSEEFLKEALQYEACPDNFREIYEKFQSFQRATLSTLLEFHRVCELHHVEYQLTYGSLLGVIRDGGQVPWDYDIDVIVPYEEKQHLIEVLEKDLDRRFYFYCPDRNKKCRHMIMRLAPVEYRTEALHVDVFFLVGSPEDAAARKLYAKRIKEIAHKRYGKLVNIREEATGDLRRYLSLLRRKKLPALFVRLDKIQREYEALCLQYSSKASSYCISADSYADWREYPTHMLWETKLIEADFGEIRIPVHYDALLKLFYGDYQMVPPIEKRIREVLYNYRRITLYQNKTRKEQMRP